MQLELELNRLVLKYTNRLKKGLDNFNELESINSKYADTQKKFNVIWEEVIKDFVKLSELYNHDYKNK